jgi:hypothetical protein
VSPDLERLLRAARGALPEPDEEPGRRARAAVVAGVERRRRRPSGRVLLAFAAALAAATAVGFGFGQRVGPEQVQAAQPRGVFGAGFLPAEGWSTFQRSRPDGAVALAANVPLSGDDVARAAGDVPVATLRTLPRRGIVIVAALDVHANVVATGGASPLVLQQAQAELRRFGGRTLLVRRLRSRADAHELDVTVYFGGAAPSAALVRLAERELQRLVVEGPKVTIQVRVTLPPHAPTTLREVEVTGTIASAEAGELVDVQVRECGPRWRFYRLAGQARTVAGGSWKLQTKRDGIDVLNLPVNAYYRARWQGSFSTPAIALAPIWSNAFLNPRNRVVTVLVSTRPSGQNLRGKLVELQRKVPSTDQWVRVRQARLRRGTRPFNTADMFQARFTVRTRGLTMRSFVPARSAAPCFSAGASEPFTS